MPITDKVPVESIDLRTRSSQYIITCSVHGQINMVLQFNGDWGRIYCQDCFEAELVRTTGEVVLDTNGGPPPTNSY